MVAILVDRHFDVACQLIAELPPGRLRRTCERDLEAGHRSGPRSFFI